MKRTATLLLACTAFGVTAQASAQSLSRGWDSYRQQQKQQTGTQGVAAPAAPSSRPAPAGVGAAPAAVGGSGSGQPGAPGRFTTVTEQTEAQAGQPAAAYPAAPVPAASYTRVEESRIERGAFIGVQRGRGEVFSGYKQDMLGLSAGYRWRAGSVTLIGLRDRLGAWTAAIRPTMSLSPQ
ncbi:conserved exported hypothetical protein [Xanthomonas phaseoli pv. phaseoli]|uniref:Secreted protein n=1 Tax=Xanthomonas campestris pv. phaseoli TaxID=317013 RepID=A0AB38E4A3_XANCH